MASALIHIAVAKKVNEYLEMDQNQLFIGSIAPDISKQIGETKYKSHFLELDNKDVPDIYKFLIEYKEDLKNPFTMGYFIHLYTDKLFYSTFMNNFKWHNHLKLINGEETKDKNLYSTYVYNDYYYLNQYLIDKYELDLNIFFNESPKLDTMIDEIPMDKIQVIIDKMGLIVAETKDLAKETFLINEEMVDKFILDTSYEIIKFLEVLK